VIRIYVAHPIGPNDADRPARIDAALAVGAQLLAAGFAPFVPGLWCAACNAEGLATYEEWMRYDFAFLDVCDALLRIPGHSPGADREVARAVARGMRVYTSVAELLAWGK
jgi:hypothetical protein